MNQTLVQQYNQTPIDVFKSLHAASVSPTRAGSAHASHITNVPRAPLLFPSATSAYDRPGAFTRRKFDITSTVNAHAQHTGSVWCGNTEGARVGDTDAACTTLNDENKQPLAARVDGNATGNRQDVLGRAGALGGVFAQDGITAFDSDTTGKQLLVGTALPQGDAFGQNENRANTGVVLPAPAVVRVHPPAQEIYNPFQQINMSESQKKMSHIKALFQVKDPNTEFEQSGAVLTQSDFQTPPSKNTNTYIANNNSSNSNSNNNNNAYMHFANQDTHSLENYHAFSNSERPTFDAYASADRANSNIIAYASGTFSASSESQDTQSVQTPNFFFPAQRNASSHKHRLFAKLREAKPVRVQDVQPEVRSEEPDFTRKPLSSLSKRRKNIVRDSQQQQQQQ